MVLKYYVVNRCEFDPPKLEENGDLVWGERSFYSPFRSWTTNFSLGCLLSLDRADNIAAEYPGSFVSSFTLMDDIKTSDH